MQTKLTAPSVRWPGEAFMAKHSKPRDSEMITNPAAVKVLNFVVTSPKTVGFLLLGFCFLNGIIQMPYNELKNAPLHFEPKADKLSDITHALRSDFDIIGTSQTPDGLMIWCDACDLRKDPNFAKTLSAVNSMLADLKKNESGCEGITWQSWTPGMTGFLSQTFLSKDGSASVVLVFRNENLELSQVSKCTMAIHRRSLDIDKMYGGLRAVLGTPIATAMVSANLEIDSVVRHIAISLPVLSVLLWFYVGSVWKAVTPVLCFIGSQACNRAVTVFAKMLYSNYNYSQPDAVVMFVQIALVLDYGVIFWGRFRQERAKYPAPEALEACILKTLKTSGLVILVSMAVLEVGFSGLLFYPDLNRSGHLAGTVQPMVSIAAVGFHSLLVPAVCVGCLPRLFDEPPPLGEAGRDPPLRPGGARHEIHPGAAQRFFRWYGGFAVRRPWVLLLPLLAYACMLPLLGQLARYKPFFNVLDMVMAKKLPEYEAYQIYKNRFTTNRGSPVSVLLRAEPIGKVPHAQLQILELGSEVRKKAARDGHLRLSGRMRGNARASAALEREASAKAEPLEMPQAAASAMESSMTPISSEAATLQLPQTIAATVETDQGVSATNSSKASEAPLARLRLPSLTPSPGRKQGGGPLAVTPEFRVMTCRVVRRILDGSRNKKFQIRPMDVEGLWWDSQAGACSQYPNFQKSRISQRGFESVLTLYPNYDSLGPEAQDLTHFMWKHVEPMNQKTFKVQEHQYRFTVQHLSVLAPMMLVNEKMSSRAPWIIGGTVIGICAVVGVFFRSVGVSVKVLLSVVLPILCDYGLLVAIWQSGWLAWAGVEPSGGVLNMFMYTTCGFLLGLAIDYDIVLFARVYERRMEGYNNTSAVRMGLAETGPMITLAGTLMCASFFVMCFDDLGMVRQLAMLYFMGVAIDTYIVRIFIAPTMLCLGGRLNYWPAKMPPEHKCWDGSL